MSPTQVGMCERAPHARRNKVQRRSRRGWKYCILSGGPFLSIGGETEAACNMRWNDVRPQARLRGVWRPSSCVIVALTVPALLLAGAASAQETTACTVAADKGQDLRDAHKPLEAREQFRICAATACPKVVQDDCTRWLEAIEAAVPSVVVTAKSDAGVDLVDVTVLVDGQPFATKLNGESLTLDPGSHAFHFEAKGASSLDRQVVVAEGQRNQQVAVVLEVSAPAPPSSPERQPLPRSPSPASTSDGLGTQKIVAAAAGGVGVIGLGVGTVFGVVALSKRSAANGVCPGTTCPTQLGSQKWSDAVAASNVSTAALIVGAAGLLAGATLWLTAPAATSAQVVAYPGGVQFRMEW
jgi:hypothetical protein